jgi:exonuclease VII small subunit
MTEFEIASAKYQKARDAYWKAESALAAARHELTIAELERSAAFNKELEAARSRYAVSTPGESL